MLITFLHSLAQHNHVQSNLEIQSSFSFFYWNVNVKIKLSWILTSMSIITGSMSNRAGRRWHHIGGRLMQIDSGPFGIVWGVNIRHYIYCRTGITWRNPKGRSWRRVPGRLKYASVGQFGVWGVNRHHNIYFRYGVTRSRPQGMIKKFWNGHTLITVRRFLHHSLQLTLSRNSEV